MAAALAVCAQFAAHAEPPARGAQVASTETSAGASVLDFGEHGSVFAIETLRTPGVWEGTIVGGSFAGGWAMRIQTNEGEVLFANAPDGSTLQSIPLGDGGRRVHVTEPLLGCGGALVPPSERRPDGSVAGSCDDGTVLDVLMKWTPAAEQGAGGPNAIRALAEAAIAMSNHVYMASGVNVFMRAVGFGSVGPYAHDAAENALPLYHLTSPNDGEMDAVHGERNELRADLVALLTAPNPSYCGVAWIGGRDSPNAGFSVTVWQCIAGATHTHEIGHNQGCCHAPGDGGGCNNGGVFPYSSGHRFTASNGTLYRTVMAYTPGMRIARLSSPIVSYVGTPTGLPSADNARTIRETAAIMASYRCSGASGCSEPPIQVRSPILQGPVSGGTVNYVASQVRAAMPGEQVYIRVSAVGDLGGSNETISLRIGVTNLGVVIGGSGFDCDLHTRITSVPASLYNSAIGSGGSVVFALTSTTAVDPCAASEISLEVQYGVAPSSCPGDVNFDGRTDGADLSVVLSAWGSCCNCVADINRSGSVNGTDLSYILSAWGGCAIGPPQVTSVSPSMGPASGGTTVTLHGTNMLGVALVTIGGVPATNLHVIDATRVRAVTPAGSVGPQAVSVLAVGGESTLQNGYTYAAVTVPPWATLLEVLPDPAVVTDAALREAITASGLAWRVLHTQTQMEMLLIPGGTFSMGCSASAQTACGSDENPVHPVTLSGAFYMGRYEVTQSQWTARMGSNPSQFQGAAYPDAADRPVERVSWPMVQGFLAQTGTRLPTEAEWEYACRAGTAAAFHGHPQQPSGTSDAGALGSIAWFSGNNGASGTPGYGTKVVGQLAGNGFGLHDMSGNVMEWVRDWYLASYYASSPANDPSGPASGSIRVLRGGSWQFGSGLCRSSDRFPEVPSQINANFGFRVARNP